MLFQTCISFFPLWNIKGDILKNFWVQTTLDPICFQCIDKKHLNIFLNIFYGMKMTEFSFLGELSL